MAHRNSKRSRTARKSRRKGSSFELEIAKALAERLGVPKNECCRTPNSGALIERSDLRFSTRVRRVFPWYIEAKKRESWALEGYYNAKWPVWAWYEDSRAKAKKDHTSAFGDFAAGKGAAPILIFSRNRVKPLVLMSIFDYNEHLRDRHPKFKYKVKLLRHGKLFIVVLFSEFLNTIERVQDA